ncbi:MAG: hypothetical protein ACYTFW_12900 [Planctomycetota bacterium]|jgi:hypothetical protein
MSNTTVTGDRLMIPASVTSEKVKSSEYIHNKPYYYSKRGTRKKRNALKAESFDIVGVSKIVLDEFQTVGYFGGPRLELKDKDGNIIDWIRLTDEQGEPLVNIIW